MTAKVLWTHDPERCGAHVLARPSLLVTAADSDTLADWYERRPWAYSVPLVLWHRDEADTVALHVFDRATRERGEDSYTTHRYLSPGGGGPCCVTAPAALLRRAGLGFAELAHDDPLRIRGAVMAARAVARVAAEGRVVWEVCAEATGGALAIGASLATGRAVAVSTETPPRLFASIADNHGVEVRAWLDREVRARLQN